MSHETDLKECIRNTRLSLGQDVVCTIHSCLESQGRRRYLAGGTSSPACTVVAVLEEGSGFTGLRSEGFHRDTLLWGGSGLV